VNNSTTNGQKHNSILPAAEGFGPDYSLTSLIRSHGCETAFMCVCAAHCQQSDNPGI